MDEAYVQLRDDLVSLRIRPGDPLDEKRLSAALGVGLTPTRDAIKRLVLEGLLVTFPRRGTFATEISVSDELWLTEVREDLEGLAAALAAERATPAEQEALRELADQLESDHGNYLTSENVEIDAAIHRTIYAATHNPHLEASLNQYTNLTMRIWNYGLRRAQAHPADCQDQADVVAAIIRGDAEEARRTAHKHLRDFSTVVRQLLTS
ncbi:GntR family transcriptional regulator [Salinifilum aidingensis]